MVSSYNIMYASLFFTHLLSAVYIFTLCLLCFITFNETSSCSLTSSSLASTSFAFLIHCFSPLITRPSPPSNCSFAPSVIISVYSILHHVLHLPVFFIMFFILESSQTSSYFLSCPRLHSSILCMLPSSSSSSQYFSFRSILPSPLLLSLSPFPSPADVISRQIRQRLFPAFSGAILSLFWLANRTVNHLSPWLQPTVQPPAPSPASSES